VAATVLRTVKRVGDFVLYVWARAQNGEKRLLASSCPSVRPHGKTPLPLDGFSRNFIFEYFFENLSRKLGSFIKL
jgi:hypothetical protein